MAGMTISAWRERFPRLLFVEAIPLHRRPIRNVHVWQLRVLSLRSSRNASRGMVEEKRGVGGGRAEGERQALTSWQGNIKVSHFNHSELSWCLEQPANCIFEDIWRIHQLMGVDSLLPC